VAEPLLFHQLLAVVGHGLDRPTVAAALSVVAAVAIHDVVAERRRSLEAERLQLALLDRTRPVPLAGEEVRAGAVVRAALDESDLAFFSSGDHTEIDVVEVFGDDPIGGGARQRGLLQ
jgi:hypothetical protein